MTLVVARERKRREVEGAFKYTKAQRRVANVNFPTVEMTYPYTKAQRRVANVNFPTVEMTYPCLQDCPTVKMTRGSSLAHCNPDVLILECAEIYHWAP